MIIRYTPEAINDLSEIKKYIGSVLRNHAAAERIIKTILDQCSELKDFPNIGTSLREKTGFETPLRMLVCENYIALYRIDDDAVSIARIINAKQDYMRFILR